jgi:hypothetical protein
LSTTLIDHLPPLDKGLSNEPAAQEDARDQVMTRHELLADR